MSRLLAPAQPRRARPPASPWPARVVLCLLWALPAPRPAEPPGDGVPADAAPIARAREPADTTATPPASASAAASATRIVSASSARSSTASPAPQQQLADDEAMVCGLGIVRVDDGAPSPQDHIPAATRALARAGLERTMATHHDVRMRAAALLMSVRAGLASPAAAEARTQDAVCRRARADGLAGLVTFCAGDAPARQAQLMAPLQAAVDQLARLAAISSDPVVLAFAQEACEPQGLSQVQPPGSCQLAGADAWARQSPQAVEPWLLLAAQSQASGDAVGAAQALARAARAEWVDTASGALAALTAQALPSTLSLLEQTSVQAELAQWDEGVPQGLPVAVEALCDTAALGDAARRADCDALARRLVDQGRAAATLSAGVQLGERLGWPARHTSALWQRLRATMDSRQRHLAAGGGLSCEGLARRRALAVLGWQVGELEAARRMAGR